MIRINFSEEDVKALDHERFYHEHPRVRKKMTALWLKSQGKAHKELGQLTGICKGTLVEYLKQYQTGGVARLKELHFHKPQSELDAHSETLKAHFEKQPVATLKEAVKVVEELTGLRRSEVQMSQFLKKLGFKPRPVGTVPAKLDPKAQADFLKKNSSRA